jgi:hypothetical protein
MICEFGVATLAGSGGEPFAEKYVVCAGGSSLGRLPTFAAAAARARGFRRFAPADEISIYEVETGIHFDVPTEPRFDGCMAPATHTSLSPLAG